MLGRNSSKSWKSPWVRTELVSLGCADHPFLVKDGAISPITVVRGWAGFSSVGVNSAVRDRDSKLGPSGSAIPGLVRVRSALL